VTTNAIRRTSPRELLAVVPYLLGFIPANSLVTLCLSNNVVGPEPATGPAQTWGHP